MKRIVTSVLVALVVVNAPLAAWAGPILDRAREQRAPSAASSLLQAAQRAAATMQATRPPSAQQWDMPQTIIGSTMLGVGAIYGLRELGSYGDCNTANDFLSEAYQFSCGGYLTRSLIGLAGAGLGAWWLMNRARVRVAPSLTHGGMRLSTGFDW